MSHRTHVSAAVLAAVLLLIPIAAAALSDASDGATTVVVPVPPKREHTVTIVYTDLDTGKVLDVWRFTGHKGDRYYRESPQYSWGYADALSVSGTVGGSDSRVDVGYRHGECAVSVLTMASPDGKVLGVKTVRGAPGTPFSLEEPYIDGWKAPYLRWEGTVGDGETVHVFGRAHRELEPWERDMLLGIAAAIGIATAALCAYALWPRRGEDGD